jgi:tRNA (guanine-N7-)-methyltransferase
LALELPPEGRTLDPANLFARPYPELWLEIGFGAGEHLAWQASRQEASEGPAGFIGAEFFINGIAKLLRQIEGTTARERIRIYQGDARALMAALPEGSLDRVFILFPDPWPKARHHKRRLVRRSSLERLSALLKDSGEGTAGPPTGRRHVMRKRPWPTAESPFIFAFVGAPGAARRSRSAVTANR